jgi:peptidoglycan hydrolase CwlO-like protein
MYRKIIIFLLFAGILLSFPKTVFCDDTLDSLNNKINDYSKKLEELGKAKDTLANQIKILDSQVELTLLKINQTETNIKNLEEEINQLSVKIDDLDRQLNELSSVYIHEVSQNYKLQKRIPAFALLLSSKFNNYFEQQKYISAVQKNSQENMIAMETTRTNYDIQKIEKTKKQQELEDLKQKLSDQQASLAKQKRSKADLLLITQNDEAKYQSLKQAAMDELNSLLTAQFVGKRNVKKGEPIGLMGNTGYSFGAHLHFGLYNLKESQLSSWQYANDIDATSYLNSHRWPMGNYDITQGRGVTQYSYLYSDKFHHGIDMVSSDKVIYAIEDGVAYFFKDKYPNQKKGNGNHVKVFHSDGMMSLYLHLQ